MEIKPIKTKKNYEAALKEIDRLFDAAPGTREGDRLELLASWLRRIGKTSPDFPAESY